MDDRSFLRTCSVGGIAGLTLAVGLVWCVPATASVTLLLAAGGGGGAGLNGPHPGGSGQITTSGETGLAGFSDGGGFGGTEGGGGGGGFYIGGGNGGGGGGWLSDGQQGNGGCIHGACLGGGGGGSSYPSFAGGAGSPETPLGPGLPDVSPAGGFGGGGAGGPGFGAGGGGGGYSGGGGGSAQYQTSEHVRLSDGGGGGGSYVVSQFTGVNVTPGVNGVPNGDQLPGLDGFVEIGTTTIGYTGSVVDYVIPTQGTYWIEAAGAQGGGGNTIDPANGQGGFGAEVGGYIRLPAGFVLDIAIGGGGESSLGGGGGGGGGTFVWAATAVPAIPELSTWAMILIGFAGLGCAGYRRRRNTIFLEFKDMRQWR
jgi:hypothetical protein